MRRSEEGGMEWVRETGEREREIRLDLEIDRSE